MATQPTTQTLQTQQPSADHPPANEIRIRVSRSLLTSLEEMRALASMPLELLVSQLVEAQIADFRLRKIPTTFLVAQNGDKFLKVESQDGIDPRRKLRPEQEDDVFELYEAGEKPPTLAKRYGVSASTVRRIIKQRRERET